MSRRRAQSLVVTLAVVAVLASIATYTAVSKSQGLGLDHAAPPAATADSSTPPTPEAAGAALAAQLAVIDEAQPIPDYRRDEFGTAWADIEGNGCKQRQDVLARDLVDETLDDDGCTVLTGTLHDPYTGRTIAFQHDRVAKPGNPGSQGVQIDHIVSLSAAHAGGAWAWSPEQRERFANSLDVLIAVDGETNAAKSDRGPAEWMPADPAYVCTYATHYAEIAARWGLAVHEADRTALIETLNTCE